MADEEILDQHTEPDEQPESLEEAEGGEPSLQDQLKEKIETRVEDVGPLRKKLTVAVPGEFISQRLNEQYTELRRDANVPGFRKGRAPRRLLEKRFGGEVGDTLVQQLVSTGYMAAIEKTDLKVIGDPMVWIRQKGSDSQTLVDVQEALESIELPAEGALEFACEVEIRPEFELPELDNIPLEKPVVTVSEEDIDRQMDRLRAFRGHFETLPEGQVEPDDVIIADVKMTSGGAELKHEENVRIAARPQSVDGVSLEKLGEALTEARVGETRTTSGQISDDYVKEEYRGKQAEFEIKVREIQRMRLPELNDEFVTSLGFENQQELRQWVRNELHSRLNEEIDRALAGQVYNHLLNKIKLEIPARLSARQFGRVLMRRMLDLYQQGLPPNEVEKHLDQIKTGAREDTMRDLKLFFIMERLAEKIEVEVSESEINNAIAAIAQRQSRRFDRVRDELARENGLMNIYMQIRDHKIVAQLISKATIKEVAPPEQGAAAAPDGKRGAAESEEPSDAAPAEMPGEPAEGAAKPRAARKTPSRKKTDDADAT